ncbi:MAG TPA: argininosuccinate lyase [Thermoanaerobaculia bacterium]|jgi:argininosuccinate lyase|nr:argininosuccinate lyase [Thermoanaerobaculia bacterium]
MATPRAPKLWGGRFEGSVDPEIHRFTASLPFDRRLARWDLVGSLAHTRMLRETAVLKRSEADAILSGLSALLWDVEDGRLVVDGDDEDVHAWIERQLFERIGEPAGRLHTGRSRNDQTSTALRLFVREEIPRAVEALVLLEETWLAAAREHIETWMPGYTHLQRGQPVSLAHHLLAHFWFLAADRRRFETAHKSAGVSPLGAGALAGSPHAIQPRRSAQLLGFEELFANSIHAVSDRDYVAETAFACALAAVHLSRWAEEVVLWTSSEFGFASLDDSVAKGSSLMPQKKNAEPAELVRGKAGRVVGDLTALLVVLKGLPLAYDSDLQEDKEALFDALDTTSGCLGAARRVSDGLVFRRERMAAALEQSHATATDLADYLALKGVAFRTAHEQAGRAVREAEKRGGRLADLPLEVLRGICPEADEDFREVLSVEKSIRARRSEGGPAPEAVAHQLELAEKEVALGRDWLLRRQQPPIYRAHLQGRILAEEIA